MKGTPAGTDVRLINVMADEKVNLGDEVLTSGGDGIYPKGLRIGTVTSVAPGHDVFLDIHLKPAAPLSSLEEVLVITGIVTKEPDTQNLGPVRAIDILTERLPSLPPPKTEAAPGPSGSSTAPPGNMNGNPPATPKKTSPPGATAAGNSPIAPTAGGTTSATPPGGGSAANPASPNGAKPARTAGSVANPGGGSAPANGAPKPSTGAPGTQPKPQKPKPVAPAEAPPPGQGK